MVHRQKSLKILSPTTNYRGGNPATSIRKRFDDATIEFLLKLAWWNGPMNKISEHLESLVTEIY